MTLRPMVTPTRPWWLATTGRPTPRPSSDLGVDVKSEKDAALAQKLGQLQPLIAVFPQACMGQLASVGST
jgi:hypothetical protein